MAKYLKTRKPIFAIILSLLAVGCTFADRVVVIPMGAEAPAAIELPTGMVSAFNSEECPTCWSKYINAQGRFVVGLNDGGTLGFTSGSALGDGSRQFHKHGWSLFNDFTKAWYTYHPDGNLQSVMTYGDGIGGEGAGYYPFTIAGNYYTSSEFHTPPYVQLLYCEKV